MNEDNSVPKDIKSNFIKMVNYLKISTHILNMKEGIIRGLETEIDKLKKSVLVLILQFIIIN